VAEVAGLYLEDSPPAYTQTSGTTIVNGQLATTNGVFINAGSLGGTGLITGNVTNAALIAPGNSPGTLDITGNYVQTADGTLQLEIGGRDSGPPSNFDRLRVTGTASLGGTVEVTLYGGFVPAPGDEFSVLTSGGLVDRDP